MPLAETLSGLMKTYNPTALNTARSPKRLRMRSGVWNKPSPSVLMKDFGNNFDKSENMLKHCEIKNFRMRKALSLQE